MKLPLSRFEIKGSSMEPTLKAGDRVLTFNFSRPKNGDIVVVKKGDKEMVKRVKQVYGESVFVVGDNQNHSIDSRDFGSINRKDVIGKVLFKY